MLVKMNVVGKETFTIDTLTGKVTGKTYHAKDFLKDNFDATWNSEEKFWTVNVEKFNNEISQYADYYKKYIDEIIETEADKKEEAANETDYVAPAKTVVSKEMINKNDGFYSRVTYRDGTKEDIFIG